MFRNKDMSVIAFANGFTLWHYKSREDFLDNICELRYFNKIFTLMNTGDIVIINGKDSTGIRQVELVGEDVWLRELK